MKKILLSTVAASFLLVSCTTAQIAQVEAQIQDGITAATSVACGIIPTAQSILNVVSALYPGLQLIALAGPAITAVEAELCSSAPPVASARYRAIPLRGSGRLPVTIGQTTHGVVVTGYR